MFSSSLLYLMLALQSCDDLQYERLYKFNIKFQQQIWIIIVYDTVLIVY